jgi:hypothetical protein
MLSLIIIINYIFDNNSVHYLQMFVGFPEGTEFSRILGHAVSLASESQTGFGVELVPYEESLSVAYAYAKAYYAETCHIFVPADADFEYRGVYSVHIYKEHCEINMCFRGDIHNEYI